MNILIEIKKFIAKQILYRYKITIPSKINKIKRKEVISVLFVLNDLSKWKSENLYLRMLEHNAFTPILGVTYHEGESIDQQKEKRSILEKYLKEKNYKYQILNSTLRPNPDIVIYTEPYGNAIPKHQSVYRYFNSLFVSINYSCHTTHLNIDYFALLHQWAWIDCYESQKAIEDAYHYIGHKRESIQLTGLPMIDKLLETPNRDPWKIQRQYKKRIIWAPHHSLGGFDGESIIYSTFLEYAEFMLLLAKKYEDKIQMAFKPHPLLKDKLDSVWGKEKADQYYKKWADLDNGQLEIGDYHDLFVTSDALIHDCSSFIVEYQVINKPSLFIVKNLDDISKDLNRFGEDAFFAQTLAKTQDDVEKFIIDILKGKDPSKDKRQNFLNSDIFEYSQGKASDNIINTILKKL